MRTRTLLIGVLSVFVLGLAIPSTVNAQVVGIKVGLNVANVSFEAKGFQVNPEARKGLVAGLFVDFASSRKVGLQLEGLISMKGAVLPFGPNDVETFRVSYLEIPVLARFNLSNSSKAHPVLLVGPALGIRLKVTSETIKSNDISRGDVGFSVGGGVEAGRGVLEVRYTRGLRNIVADGSATLKNRAIAVMVGVRSSK